MNDHTLNHSSGIQPVDSPLNHRGRFGRLAYLGWMLVFILVFYVIAGIGIFMFISGSQSAAATDSAYSILSIIAGLVLFIAYVGLLYYNFVAAIRRLHDLNKTGWLSLLMLVPFINLFFMIYLALARGTPGQNDYGMPRQTRGWEKVMGWLYALVVPIALIGILTAIAIPAYQNYVHRAQMMQHLGDMH